MIKTIIFDLGGVYFTDGTKEAIKSIAAKYNLTEDKVKDVLKGDLGTQYRVSQITADEFWDKAKEYWEIEAQNDELAQMWLQEYKPIQGTIDIIQKLKDHNYELIFLSDNVKERVDYLENTYHFLHYFKDGIFSHLVKIRKPDPQIYKLILEKSSHPASECIYVDDKEELLQPAQELGMQIIHFQSPQQLKDELIAKGISFQ